jgi:actin-related protein 6
MNEIVYEYFSFHSYLRKPAACFTAHNFARTDPKLRLGLTVVDSGFSYTHIVPFINEKYQRHAVKRINVGGKLLTNYLKEMVSYRQWNMMDEFILMNQVKEQLCYVSDNIINDLELARRLTRAERAQRLRKHFVLPDFQNVMKGFVKPDSELITPNEQVIWS